jgi:hypothetical protein
MRAGNLACRRTCRSTYLLILVSCIRCPHPQASPYLGLRWCYGALQCSIPLLQLHPGHSHGHLTTSKQVGACLLAGMLQWQPHGPVHCLCIPWEVPQLHMLPMHTIWPAMNAAGPGKTHTTASQQLATWHTWADTPAAPRTRSGVEQHTWLGLQQGKTP